MKTVLFFLALLASLPSWSQKKPKSSYEIVPFYFEKSGVRVSILFKHSLIYASTRSFMISGENDVEADPFLSFDFLPSHLYYSCATRQLEALGEALKSKEVAQNKNKFLTLQISVMITPNSAVAAFCTTAIRSSEKQLNLTACLLEQPLSDQSCRIIPAPQIIAHYTQKNDLIKLRADEEARMNKAAESILKWIQP